MTVPAPWGVLEVTRTGPRTLLLRDRRSGWSSFGVPPCGPFDRGAFRAGRALVGGGDDTHAFECVLGGLAFRTTVDVPVAVTGAAVRVTIDGQVVEASPTVLRAGAELALGMPPSGLRTYVWVGGGLRSGPTGTLAGFGPALITPGSTMAIEEPAAPWQPSAVRRPDQLEVLPGPRLDHLADPGQLATEWVVSPHSDRVGVRLDGPPLDRTTSNEVPPEGIVRGAIQAPPGGQLVVFGPDHPTTGGYPVVGVLTPESVDVLAQRRPGEKVRLRWVRLSG